MEPVVYPFETTKKYLDKLDGSITGRSFLLAMDEGKEYFLRFVSGETVEYRAEPDGDLRWEHYGCLKADEKTWFLAGFLSDAKLRTCVTLVLDEESRLVTMVISRLGLHPGRPRLIDTEFRFGALRVPGKPLPAKRHGFTRDLVSKKMNWHYAPGQVNTHIYLSERYSRLHEVRRAGGVPAAPQQQNPPPIFYDEPVRYVRIREGMYLISFVEENINRTDPAAGGHNMIVLVNEKARFECGRTFTTLPDMGLEHGFFKAYCEPTDADVPEEHIPSPYRV